MDKAVASLCDSESNLGYVIIENVTSLFGVGEEGKCNVTGKEKNKNTERATNSHVKLLTKWLESNGEYRKPEDISPAELDVYLANFFSNVKKENTDASGDLEHINRQYEPGSLMAIHSSIQRYLAMKGYKNNIKIDEEFKNSRDILIAKRKELEKLGKGLKVRKALAFTDDQLELFWALNLLGISKRKFAFKFNIIFEIFIFLKYCEVPFLS